MEKFYFQGWESEKQTTIELKTISDVIGKFSAQAVLDGLMKKNRNPNITKAYLVGKNEEGQMVNLAEWTKI